jgi:uncharacterized protein
MLNMTTTVTEINIYPVKSLGGISVDSIESTSRGLQHDRRFMLIDAKHEFLTQREHPQMATIRTAIDGNELVLSSPFEDSITLPLQPRAMPTRTVKVWSSRVHAHTVSAEADTWLSDYLQLDARLVYMPDSTERRVSPEYARDGDVVSFADGYPVLIASEESLAELNKRIMAAGGNAVTMDRFRANIVVKGQKAFAEDTWRDFRIGSAVFRGVKPCTRCQITTTDQATGEVLGPEPLRTLATFRDLARGVRFGMNLLTTKLGALRVGDSVSFNE